VPKPLRLGIAGLGAAARQILPHAAKSAAIELAAAADIRPEACAEFQAEYGRKTFPSVRALCESGEVDAVWIATPNVFHAEHTVAAAQCGKHIIVEKPTAVTLAEAREMIAAADRHGVRLVQGHSKIYGPAIKKMRDIVASGALGRPIQINSWNFNDWLQRPRLASEVDTRIGGGVCLRQGPHQVDIVRYLGGGRVKSVRAITGRADPNFNTEGDYTAFLEFEDGPAATLAFNGYGYFDAAELTWDIGEGGKRFNEAEAYARKARLTGAVDQDYKYANPRTTEARAGRERSGQSFFGLTVVACERGAIRQSPQGLLVYSEDGREEIACPPDQGRAAELNELSEAVAQGRPVFPDGRWGMASLEVCLAMLQSSNERREITLSHQVACP
jgi:phthalate 4,5-cis-dihydrodiol dehydrogenase